MYSSLRFHSNSCPLTIPHSIRLILCLKFREGEDFLYLSIERFLYYFPFDVDFFNDEKIVAISGEFGIKGEIVVIKLLCAIYRNGYFILWNDLLKFKLLRDLPGVSSELLDSIMNRLVLWGFFDKDLFDSMGVLTSAGIQKRYFKISKRRKSVC